MRRLRDQREPLDDVEVAAMGNAAIGQEHAGLESDRVYDERVALDRLATRLGQRQGARSIPVRLDRR
jgi:hypothetical protein